MRKAKTQSHLLVNGYFLLLIALNLFLRFVLNNIFKSNEPFLL